jgi:hypothetical protein
MTLQAHQRSSKHNRSTDGQPTNRLLSQFQQGQKAVSLWAIATKDGPSFFSSEEEDEMFAKKEMLTALELQATK